MVLYAQDECCGWGFEFDHGQMSSWTEAQARCYFETGARPDAAAAGVFSEPAALLHQSSASYNTPLSHCFSIALFPFCCADGKAPPLGRRPRVLCVHGTAGNQNIFGTQIGGLMSRLKHKVDFQFVQGRSPCAPTLCCWCPHTVLLVPTHCAAGAHTVLLVLTMLLVLAPCFSH